MVHIMSEAVRSQSPVVDIGRSVRNTLICLGLDTAGREYATFGRQMSALLACRLSLGFDSERFDVWEDSADAREKRSRGLIELTPAFFASLTKSAVPLDERALSALKHNSFALDVYTWLVQRLHRVKRGESSRLTWKNLKDQFGQEYADPKNFQHNMRKTLRSVLAVYPSARIKPVFGGFILLPSQPAVPKY
jgi:hypothetical protein